MRYVVLGASAAGINGVRELRRLDPESEIILVSRDRKSIPDVSCTTTWAESGTRKESALQSLILRQGTG